MYPRPQRIEEAAKTEDGDAHEEHELHHHRSKREDHEIILEGNEGQPVREEHRSLTMARILTKDIKLTEERVSTQSKQAYQSQELLPSALEEKLARKFWRVAEAHCGDEFRRGVGLHRQQNWSLN